MSRNRQPANDEPAQPTRPRAVDAQGYQLAEDGLPLSGPARARALQDRAATQGAAEPQPRTKTDQEG
ncbi:MAG: hypothetical protein K2X73_04775 [Sphingomonas sp.]|uniref:hypothetical protein n=1 Tax=Sphingomonas sp. TaxID=28214 RepID=UPI0025D1FFA4|nr:hypothetical protein [Sphingomonas sp.]MBX9881268.1 hypothetical protein [Sphingomonas sp.]